MYHIKANTHQVFIVALMSSTGLAENSRSISKHINTCKIQLLGSHPMVTPHRETYEHVVIDLKKQH